MEQFETATVVDRQTSPSQTSVHEVSVSLQRTMTRSMATDWTQDRAGVATDPQPNTVSTITEQVPVPAVYDEAKLSAQALNGNTLLI